MCGICLCRKNLLTPLLALSLHDHNGSLRRKFLQEGAYTTLRPQKQLTRDPFYKQSGHKQAVRQLHEVENEDEREASPRHTATTEHKARFQQIYQIW